MKSNPLKFFTFPEARALACALGACECHHNRPDGGSLSENAHRVIERYESERCSCYKLIKNLSPDRATEAVALYLRGRSTSWDGHGQYFCDGDLDHFRSLARAYDPTHVLRYIFVEKKINIALDHLEGIPPDRPE